MDHSFQVTNSDHFQHLISFLTEDQFTASRNHLFSSMGDENHAICSMLGDWLSGRITKINQSLQDGAQRAVNRESLKGMVDELYEQLSDLHAAVGINFKDIAMASTPFTRDEVDHLVSSLEELKAFSSQLAEVLVKQDPAKAIQSLRESPTWRQAIKTNAEAKVDPQWVYLPLLECIANETKPSLKAELTAKMELYIASGHAEKDCIAPLDEKKATPATKAMRELCNQLRDESITPSDARKAMFSRFNELFMTAKVSKEMGMDGEEKSVLVFESEKSRTLTRTATKGNVDALIRDARNPKVLHAAIVTSDESTWVENNQMIRHATALKEAIKNQPQEVQDVKMSFYVPSLFYDQKAEKGRDIGDAFTSSLKDGMTTKERQTLNMLPFVSVIKRVDRNHPHLDISVLADIELRLIGGQSEAWNALRQEVNSYPQEHRKEALLEHIAKIGSESLEILQKKNPTEDLIRTTGTGKILMGALCETLEGVTHHAVPCPHVLKSVEDRVPEMKALKVQLSGDSEMKPRMELLISHYRQEGGIKAWARTVMEDDLEAKAMLQEQRKERGQDIAKTKEMIQQFAHEQIHANGLGSTTNLDFIQRALKADTQSVHGFSEQEKSDIEKIFDPKAINTSIQAQATQQLRMAIDRGDFQEAHFWIKTGADIKSVNEKGETLADYATTKGRPEIAILLSMSRTTQMLEKDLREERVKRIIHSHQEKTI